MISIHKSHTRNDMISMIEHLPLPIMVAKSDMKDDLKKKISYFYEPYNADQDYSTFMTFN